MPIRGEPIGFARIRSRTRRRPRPRLEGSRFGKYLNDLMRSSSALYDSQPSQQAAPENYPTCGLSLRRV
jgi:hypothetical protein